MDVLSTVEICLALLFILSIQRALLCSVSPRCECTDIPNTDITCDISTEGIPMFNDSFSHVRYRTVVIKGSSRLPDFLFQGLNAQGVKLSGLDMYFTGCQLLSGLEDVLEDVDLSDNNLLYIPFCTLKGFYQLKRLNVSRNKVSTFPRITIFVNLINLESLDLSSNNIVSIDDEALSGLQSLEILDLSNNKLKILTFLRHLKTLRVLSLQGNGLNRLLEHVFNELTELEDLNLSENQLITLPSFILSLPKLRCLTMARNHLSSLDLAAISIPDHRFSLLDFSYNNISYAANILVAAEDHFEMSLRENKLGTSVNFTIIGSEKKTSDLHIDLSSNYLLRAPFIKYKTSHDGVAAIYLDLSKNKLTTYDYLQPEVHSEVPVSLSNTRVSYVLRHNLLDSFPPCVFFHKYNVDLLDLSFNFLRSLPKGACIGTSVKELRLNYNKLTKIERVFFGGVQSNTPVLENLKFVGNQINMITPDAFESLDTCLREVDLRDNRLVFVPDTLFNLTSLDKIHLKGNPLDCECDGYFSIGITRLRSVVDKCRCLTPSALRGYLLTCVWHNCNHALDVEDCTMDQFVGIEANVSNMDSGLKVTWVLYGPGNTSQIRLNVTENGRNTPTYVHLVDPKVSVFYFLNVPKGNGYSLCVEVLSVNGVSLSSRCFFNLTHSGKQEIVSRLAITHKTSLIAVSGLAVALTIILFLICVLRRRCGKNSSRNNSENNDSYFGNHLNHTKEPIVAKNLCCLKILRRKYEIHAENPVVFSDLLLNDSEDCTDNCDQDNQFYRQNQNISSNSDQPTLPPRNSQREKPVKVDQEPRLSCMEERGDKVGPNSSPLLSMSSGPQYQPQDDEMKATSKNQEVNSSRNKLENVYESGFNLVVCLDDRKSSTEEKPDTQEDIEENIYEDTLPVEYYRASNQTLTETDAMTTYQNANCKPFCQEKEKRRLNPAVSGYECPKSIRIIHGLGQHETETGKLNKDDTKHSDTCTSGFASPSVKEPLRTVENPTYNKEAYIK